jgi:large subunit ribosomal protein L4
MKLNVIDIKGKQTGRTADLSDKVFKVEPHDHSIWLDVRSVRANNRQGTHKTKSRSEVRGGGRKPFRQVAPGRERFVHLIMSVGVECLAPLPMTIRSE